MYGWSDLIEPAVTAADPVATHPASASTPTSSLDLPVFATVFALAVIFQLARGDMGLFPEWRATPNGATLGDGWVPQVWFAAALLTLARPRVWSLVLLAACGVFDLWWRLPVSSPSIFFHGLVSAQLLVTAVGAVVAERSLRITGESYIERLRAPLLSLLVILFAFAVFHKFTSTAFYWTSGFFDLLTSYYAPFYPADGIPVSVHWGLTVGGEAILGAALFFRRTRALGVLACVAFACFVGMVVYGFGSIVMAAAFSLGASALLLEPIRRSRLVRGLGKRASAGTWRLALTFALACVFLLDHESGFTLADRGWMFEAGEKPGLADVITPMQVVWFAISTGLLVSVSLAFLEYGPRVLAHGPRPANLVAFSVAVVFVLSEVGLYVGLKETPNVAMFSGLRVKSRTPNHFIARDRLLNAYFHRDLVMVDPQDGEPRLGTPPLALRELQQREERLGVVDTWVETYRTAPHLTRLRDGREEAFEFAELADVEPRWLEVLLPRRLFALRPATEPDLRASMPELFEGSDADSR